MAAARVLRRSKAGLVEETRPDQRQVVGRLAGKEFGEMNPVGWREALRTAR